MKILFLIILLPFILCQNISNVHIIFSNHLDVGFSTPFLDKNNPAYAVSIINIYFKYFYPDLINTINKLGANGINYIYTDHAWMVSLYLHCSPDMVPSVGNNSLLCPSIDDQQNFRKAIIDGHITWTAMPFNTHIEMQNNAVLQLQFDFVRKLDQEFGLLHKRVVSQRDVPGLTAGAISTFLRNDIDAISVGGNIMAAIPNVPKIFQWQHPLYTSLKLITMFSSSGYGSFEKENAVILPNSSDALVFDWRTDNVGSGTVSEVINVIRSVQEEFPGANVFPSTFEKFISAIDAISISKLPIIKGEIGDTWIHGTQSDPYKIQIFRYIAHFMEENKVDINDPVIQKMIFRYLKASEHTFGLDENIFLADYSNWHNDEFNLVKNSTSFQNMANSWMEQRDYLNFEPKNNNILRRLSEELNILKNLYQSSLEEIGRYSIPILPNKMQVCEKWNITFGTSGDIVYLSNNGHIIFDGYNSSIHFSHQTLDDDDIINFLYAYGRCVEFCPEWYMQAFGKQGLADYKSISGIFRPKTISIKKSRNECIYVINAQPIPNIYGPPEMVHIIINLTDSSSIYATLLVTNKTASRMPEAYWFTFIPVPNNASWFVHKVDTWIPINDIILNGNMHMHGTYEGVISNKLGIRSFDSGIVSVGIKSPFPTPFQIMNPNNGFHFLLYNNVFGTNYPSWYPFVENNGNMIYRFLVNIK